MTNSPQHYKIVRLTNQGYRTDDKRFISRYAAKKVAKRTYHNDEWTVLPEDEANEWTSSF